MILFQLVDVSESLPSESSRKLHTFRGRSNIPAYYELISFDLAPRFEFDSLPLVKPLMKMLPASVCSRRAALAAGEEPK